MAGFVVGDSLFLVSVHDAALAFEADGPSFDRLVEMFHADDGPPRSCGHERRFVDDVLEVGADRTGRQAGNAVQVERRRPRRTSRICTFKMASRPLYRDDRRRRWRSKRPGRIRAWSSVSGRLVAAMMMTPRLLSKPSISTSS